MGEDCYFHVTLETSGRLDAIRLSKGRFVLGNALLSNCKDDPEHGKESKETRKVLQCLLQNESTAQCAQAVGELARHMSVSEKTSLRHLEAAAETCARGQAANLEHVTEYILSLQGWVSPLALVIAQKYDETQIRLKVAFHEEEMNEGEVQKARAFVIETSWMAIVRRDRGMDFDEENPASNQILLHGTYSSALRAANNTTAEAIAGILCSAPHPSESVLKAWPRVIRLAEADEAASNTKAERLLKQHYLDQGVNITTMQWACTAHKLHAMADKVWQVMPATMSGICSVLLALQTSSQISLLRDALESLIQDRSQTVSPAALSADAVRHRQSLLECYLPPISQPRKRAVVLSLFAVCNGDWRLPRTIQHVCAGERCCSQPRIAAERMVQIIRKMLRSLRPSRLCRANWLEWTTPLIFIALLEKLNFLLQDAFALAFGNHKVLVF